MFDHGQAILDNAIADASDYAIDEETSMNVPSSEIEPDDKVWIGDNACLHVKRVSFPSNAGYVDIYFSTGKMMVVHMTRHFDIERI